MGRIILLIFFLIGCTKYSKIETNQYGNYFFQTDQLHFKDVDLIPWKVGITSKQILTKGILISISFPRLKNKDIFTLNEKGFVNAWIVRVRRSSSLGSSVLGHFYSPFLLPGIPGMEKLRAKTIKSMTLQILYLPATLPDELILSPCPPMNHRKIISEILVDPRSDKTPIMTLVPNASYNLDESIPDYSYQTPTINGGNDLLGVYHFEIAFFNYENKKIIGDWVEYPETLTVVRENEIPLEECYNYTPPKLRPDYNDFRRFKWKENMFKDEGR